MSYIQCPHCGQRALSVATRCPHCGRPFESRLWQYPAARSRRRRIPVGLIITGALIAVVVVSFVQREPRVTVSTPSARPSVIAVDSAPPPRTKPRSASVGATADSGTVRTPTPAPPDFGPAERRYASTWVNLRSRRSSTAPVVRILEPGETVMVDSLRQGWYRAVAYVQTLGYVDRSLVGPARKPPPR